MADKCFKCSSSLDDKKFPHPLDEEKFFCLNCFEDNRLQHNHITLFSKGTRLEAKGGKNIKADISLGLVLCTEGPNSNDDGFDEDSLLSDYSSAMDQKIDWEHDKDQVVGVMTDSEFVKQNSSRASELDLKGVDRSLIYVQGLFWKLDHIGKAKDIVQRYEQGCLYYSMETYFDYAKCSECGGEFVYDTDYCEHLTHRHSTSNDFFRILKGNKFCGAGIVKRPADRNAVGLSVASDQNKYKIMSKLLDVDILDYYAFVLKKRNKLFSKFGLN